MKLVDLKSRAKVAITIPLSPREYGITKDLPGTVVNRSIAEKDKVSGETRARDVKVRCPSAVRIPAGGVAKGLPATVLLLPQVKSLIARHSGRRPKLVVTKQYDSAPPAAAKKASKKASKKKSSKKK